MNHCLIFLNTLAALRITKKDGQNLLGRVVSADDNHIFQMLVGNQVVQVPCDEIQAMENDMKSLMYEGLIQRMTETEVNALLDYIISLSK